jgi:hypothetical protein
VDLSYRVFMAQSLHPGRRYERSHRPTIARLEGSIPDFRNSRKAGYDRRTGQFDVPAGTSLGEFPEGRVQAGAAERRKRNIACAKRAAAAIAPARSCSSFCSEKALSSRVDRSASDDRLNVAPRVREMLLCVKMRTLNLSPYFRVTTFIGASASRARRDEYLFSCENPIRSPKRYDVYPAHSLPKLSRFRS